MNSTRGKPSASSSESEHSVDDIWDDTLIIRNYEESLAVVKEVVAKRLAMKTNKKASGQLKIKTEAAEQPGTSTATAAQGPKSSQQDEGESSGVEGSTNGCTEKGASETGAKQEYKVGDCCRATYEDGVDYEAKILAVEKVTGSALIRYIGYNNEQAVAIDDLVPSWGRKARRKQREDAAEEAAEEDSHRMEMSDDDNEKLTKKASKIRINFDPNFARSPKRAGGGGGAAVNGYGAAGMPGASFMVPPPPPMPPMLEGDDDPESENLSAMLMSWYMSGYYTGLYHGQKMSQKRARPS